MQPFSLMPEELSNLQPCTLHLYYTLSSCKGLLGCKQWKFRKWIQAPVFTQVECHFSTVEYKRPFRMNMQLKAILYKLFFISLTFLSHSGQKHRIIYAGRNLQRLCGSTTSSRTNLRSRCSRPCPVEIWKEIKGSWNKLCLRVWGWLKRREMDY